MLLILNKYFLRAGFEPAQSKALSERQSWVWSSPDLKPQGAQRHPVWAAPGTFESDLQTGPLAILRVKEG